jgi:hypothetical protein
VDDNIETTWDDILRDKNDQLETNFMDHNMFHLSKKMLFIGVGNHRFNAWYKNKSEKIVHADFHVESASIVLDNKMENHALITSLCDDIIM